VTVDSIADITAMPIASIGASALTGTAPMTVNFAGSASGGTSPYTYSWSFGDGGTSTEQNPSHIYVKAGAFTAKFTVIDNVGKKAGGSATVSVAAASTATPTANFIAFPASGLAPHAVRFAGMASGGSSPYAYRWDFGDGTTSTERNPSHTYTQPGTYTVILTITDGRSMSTVKTMTVRVVQRGTTGTTAGGATGKVRTRLGLPARTPIFR
jgi:PKD repeat protein